MKIKIFIVIGLLMLISIPVTHANNVKQGNIEQKNLEVTKEILNDSELKTTNRGTDLGLEFGISRAAIGKNIQKIEQNYNLEVFAVKGKERDRWRVVFCNSTW